VAVTAWHSSWRSSWCGQGEQEGRASLPTAEISSPISCLPNNTSGCGLYEAESSSPKSVLVSRVCAPQNLPMQVCSSWDCLSLHPGHCLGKVVSSTPPDPLQIGDKGGCRRGLLLRGTEALTHQPDSTCREVCCPPGALLRDITRTLPAPVHPSGCSPLQQ